LGKPAETPLIDVGEGRAIQALDRHAIDDGAFRGVDAEEVLAVSVDGEDLIEDLAAGERVIDGELDRRGKL